MGMRGTKPDKGRPPDMEQDGRCKRGMDRRMRVARSPRKQRVVQRFWEIGTTRSDVEALTGTTKEREVCQPTQRW